MQEIILVIVSIFVWTRFRDYLIKAEEENQAESKTSMLFQAVKNNKEAVLEKVPEEHKAEVKVLLSHLELNAKELYRLSDKSNMSIGERIGSFIGDIKKGARK